MLARLLATSPRTTVVVLFACALLASRPALAQGLGELSLQSALNEPLRATIELLDTGGLEVGQVAIAAASSDEYAQAGLQRDSIVSQIEFRIELQPGGSGRVTLSTRDRVTEPFLTLLVAARWPSGRVLREYTILLDLPSDAAGQAPAAPAAPLAGMAAGPAAAGADSTYAVQAGDSLWQIAEQTRPSTDVSVPQMMIAIQRANEDAFVNNNVNRLISGRVLRIPRRDEIGIIEHSAAVAQINAQNQQLGLTPLGGAAAGSGGAVRDELSVLGGEDAAPAGAGSSDLAATIAALEAELMLSEEDLDRARIENEELTGRLDELEQQIAILTNIIAIEDERIAQLQNALATQANVTEQALAEAGRAAEALAAAGRQAPAQGLVGQLLALLQNNLVFIGGALAVVLALLGVLMAKARKAREESEQAFADGAALLDDDDEQDEFDPGLATGGPDDAVSAAHADISGEEAQPGFVARLLARFRRKGRDDEAAVADALTGFDAPAGESPAAAPTIEVDEIPDDLAAGLYADDEPLAVMSQPLAEPEVDEVEEAEEAAALASSVLDEVDDALRAVDAGLATADSAAADDMESLDDAELEFDLPEAGAVADTIPETFEFKVAPVMEPAPAEPEPAGAEVETFAFKLEPVDTAAPAAPASTAAPEPALETFEFRSGADSDLDLASLGSLSFDEEDAGRAADEEAAYTPRTNMDECDTKLDLAVAYEAMGDIDGALEILDEVIAEGKPAQIEEAQRLKTKWQDA